MFGKKTREIEELRRTILALQQDSDLLNQQLARVTAQRDVARKDLREMQKKVREMLKKVREQTAADLLINALEAVGIIKPKEPKDLDWYTRRNLDLQQQMSNTTHQLGQQQGLVGLGGHGGILWGLTP